MFTELLWDTLPPFYMNTAHDLWSSSTSSFLIITSDNFKIHARDTSVTSTVQSQDLFNCNPTTLPYFSHAPARSLPNLTITGPWNVHFSYTAPISTTIPLLLPVLLPAFCPPSSINNKSFIGYPGSLFSVPVIALSNNEASIMFLWPITSVGKPISYTLSNFSVYAQEHYWRKPEHALALYNTPMLISTVPGMPTTIPWFFAGNCLPNSSVHIIPACVTQNLLYLSCIIHGKDFLKQLNITGLISPSHLLNIHLFFHLTSLNFHLLQRHFYHHLSDFQSIFWTLRSFQKSNITLTTSDNLSPCLVLTWHLVGTQ